jgi:phosphohistidine phosphatase
MRRRLILLRHAKSAWPVGVGDHDRPLARRGRQEAPLAGRWLNEHAREIDLAVCSSANRARQTWVRVAEELDSVPELCVSERLYAASAENLIAVARELPDAMRTVLFIAHNPGLESLVSDLARTDCRMKTCSIAVLSGSGTWCRIAPGWAALDAAETPRP